MTSALSDNLPPGKTVETAIRTALAEEEKIYHILNDQKLAQKNQLNDTRSSIDWLSSARLATEAVLDSSADVVEALNSFIVNLSSAISIHESDQLHGDLRQSLPSTDAAKRTWGSLVEIVDSLLMGIERLKPTTSSHTKCMGIELDAHKTIEGQTVTSLDIVTKSTDALSLSMDHKRSILHPIRRLPTEILERIFELATLDERLTLRRDLVIIHRFYLDKNDFSSTIPCIPTVLASTCRRWRTIALGMPRLWSFLRVPTLESYRHTLAWRTCVVGLSTFQMAKSCIGASKCEMVLSLLTESGMEIDHLHSIPSSQISTLNIVMPLDGTNLSEIPTVTVLRIYGQDCTDAGEPVRLPFYYFPPSVLANTRELNCHHALPDVDAPILSVTSFSLTFFKNHTYFPDLGLLLADFPNLIAVVLSANIDSLHLRRVFTPFHHIGIRTLSITDTVIPHLCALLQEGALSLPSLTHFILLDIFPSSNSNREEWGQLKSLFVNVTCFEIRAATQQGCGSNIRQLLDVMPLLQQFTVFGSAVDDGLQALLITPVKRISKLVVSDSETDGSNVKSYYDALRLEPVNHPDNNISIQFVYCPGILPQIREQLSS